MTIHVLQYTRTAHPSQDESGRGRSEGLDGRLQCTEPSGPGIGRQSEEDGLDGLSEIAVIILVRHHSQCGSHRQDERDHRYAHPQGPYGRLHRPRGEYPAGS